MYARVTPFRMKPGSRDEAMRIMEEVKGRILGLAGMQQFLCCMDDDGSGYVIATVESKAASDGNAAQIAEIWSAFAGLLAEPPVPAGYDLLADWTPQPA